VSSRCKRIDHGAHGEKQKRGTAKAKEKAFNHGAHGEHREKQRIEKAEAKVRTKSEAKSIHRKGAEVAEKSKPLQDEEDRQDGKIKNEK